MSAPRLSHIVRRSRRQFGVHLTRASRRLRQPKLREITPEVRAILDAYRDQLDTYRGIY